MMTYKYTEGLHRQLKQCREVSITEADIIRLAICTVNRDNIRHPMISTPVAMSGLDSPQVSPERRLS